MSEEYSKVKYRYWIATILYFITTKNALPNRITRSTCIDNLFPRSSLKYHLKLVNEGHSQYFFDKVQFQATSVALWALLEYD